MRFRRILDAAVDAGEIETSAGRAMVEERYGVLRNQVPIIYLLAVVNLGGLELSTGGKPALGLNLPTVLVLCALVRMAQWFRSENELSHQAMLRRLQQTWWLATVLSLAVCAWCINLSAGEPALRLPITLFGGFTAIGAAYGLSFFPPPRVYHSSSSHCPLPLWDFCRRTFSIWEPR